MARLHSKPDPTGSAVNVGELNPARLDVTARPARKRKARNRPPPHKELVEAEAKLEQRALRRQHPPGVMLEAAGYDEEHWTSPHSDVGLWELQLAEAFGTRSQAVITTFMGQLEHLCSKFGYWDEKAQQWRMNEHEFSAALAIVSSMQPENEMQAMLAAQMVSVHFMQMKLAARAIKYDTEIRTAAVAGKLARTFAEQARAMQEIKGKRRSRSTRQSIHVTKEEHKHVHYHEHRGGGDQTGSHPVAPIEGAYSIPDGPALPSPDQSGAVVPFPGGEGKAGLPNARSKGGRT